MQEPMPHPHQEPNDITDTGFVPTERLDTRTKADPRESYPEEVQRQLRAAEMLIVGAHHNLEKGQTLSDSQRAILGALGVLPETN